MEGRIRQIREQKDDIRTSRDFEMGVWMDFEPTRRNLVYEQEQMCLKLGELGQLEVPRIELRPEHQLLLTGPNGAGKSTLLERIVQLHKLEAHEVIYLPQEIPMAQSKLLLEEVRQVEKEQLGRMMQIVRRLGSDPGRLLESALPSPGEMRKLLLAMGILKQPAFLVMDEPTNHLDLPSIECLQQALQNCPVGYLIVSHDQAFCDALEAEVWEIRGNDGTYTLVT